MSFAKKTIRDIDLTGKRVLMRADYNVPVKNRQISDDYRIKQSLPTVNYILDQKGTSLVIVSHLGRPKDANDKDCSLAPVAARLGEMLGKKVRFATDCIGSIAQQAAADLQPGEVLILENVRYHPEEEKNDPEFAKQIVEASAAQVFVQDGFGVVHRAHATTDAVVKLLPSVAGFLLEKEVEAITQVMQNPNRPLLAVIGGAKISDKIDILKRFIELADCVAVVGAMANNFLVAAGTNVGKSLIENEVLETARDILDEARLAEQQRAFSFLMPLDGVVSTAMDGSAPTRVVDFASHTLADIQAYPRLPEPASYTVGKQEMILDIGPMSASQIAGAIKLSRTVIWNGPCGVTEVIGGAGPQRPFAHGTRTIAEAMIGSSNQHRNKPYSLVGGGDTAAYVESESLVEDFNHVSTGGGASLELMAGKSLPGIEVLADRDK